MMVQFGLHDSSSSSSISSDTINTSTSTKPCVTQANFVNVVLSVSSSSPLSFADADAQVVSATRALPPPECADFIKSGGGGSSSSVFVECSAWLQLFLSALDVSGIRRSSFSSGVSSSVTPADNWDAASSALRGVQSQLLQQQQQQQAKVKLLAIPLHIQLQPQHALATFHTNKP